MIVVQPSFGQKNVTLRLSLDLEGMQSMIDGLTYGIVFASLFEETILVFPAGNDTSVELIMFYNTEYNLSTFAALCGFESRSHAFSLFYGEFIMTLYNTCYQ